MNIQDRITEVAAGNIGVLTALLSANQNLGEKVVSSFLDKVPEKGSALWDRYRAFQAMKRAGGATMEFTFQHFIAAMVVPGGLAELEGGQTEASKFVTQIKRLHPKQALFITFAKNGMESFIPFVGLAERGEVRMEQGDLLTARAVKLTQDWDSDRNRTFKVSGMQNVVDAMLMRIARGVEKISVLNHGAKAIFTGNVHRREEAQATIVRAVLTKELRAEVEEWGLGIYADGANPDGIPALEFTIRDSDMNVLTSVTLDGWSGRMAVDGRWGDFLYINPQQLEWVIKAAINRYLEKATAMS